MKFENENQKDCETWEDFLEYLEQIRQWITDKKQKPDAGFITELVFRGVNDSTFKMEDSLEWKSKKTEYLIVDYYNKILRASLEDEHCIKEKWTLPTLSYYSNLMKKAHGCTFRNCLFPPAYPDVRTSFLYLRHHGYPSPMLDWTGSPYIAAYFAIEDQKIMAEKVSIFIFLESKGEPIDGAPGIHTLGPHVDAPDRHFKQESQYTFCVKEEAPKPGSLKEEPSKKFFASHKDAFAGRPDNQQYRWKCDIPSTEREKIRKLLDSRDITEATLFEPGKFFMATDNECHSFLED